MANKYYEEKRYGYAQLLYEDVTAFVRGTPRYEDLFYRLAYSYYYQNDFLNAENLFKTFVETFPYSTRSEECEYMRAFTYFKQSPKVDLDQTNTNKAVGLLQAFISIHPNSSKVKEANSLIDVCREKLELKDFKAAELYYNIGYYKASSISFANLQENYPDTKKGDYYKLMSIRSYLKYAELSFETKQKERFEKVISECNEFKERFQDSELLASVNDYKKKAKGQLELLKKSVSN